MFSEVNCFTKIRVSKQFHILSLIKLSFGEYRLCLQIHGGITEDIMSNHGIKRVKQYFLTVIIEKKKEKKKPNKKQQNNRQHVLRNLTLLKFAV